MEEFKFDVNNFDREAYYLAFSEFEKLFPQKNQNWYQTSVQRLKNAKYVIKKGKQHVIEIEKNEKFGDTRKHTVYVSFNPFRHWCNCSITSRHGGGIVRLKEICTHVGAAVLLVLYLKYLNRLHAKQFEV
jgi:hypothetical protein